MTASLIQSFTLGQTILFSAPSYNGPNWLTEFEATGTQHAIQGSALFGAIEDLTRSHHRKYCWCSVLQVRQLEAHASASSQARWGWTPFAQEQQWKCIAGLYHHAYWQMVKQQISTLHQKASGAVLSTRRKTNAHVLVILKDTGDHTTSSFNQRPPAVQPP
jgi:hypothetical protein